jgi:hypothetical protein
VAVQQRKGELNSIPIFVQTLCRSNQVTSRSSQMPKSGKRGRDGNSRGSADRSYEELSVYTSSESNEEECEEEERGATKRRMSGQSSGGKQWSQLETLQLKKLKEDGLKWEEITKSFPGKSWRACESRYSYVNEAEKQVKVPWSKESSQLLKKLREVDRLIGKILRCSSEDQWLHASKNIIITKKIERKQ